MRLFFRIFSVFFGFTLFAACSSHSSIPSTNGLAGSKSQSDQRSTVAGAPTSGHGIAEYPISGESYQVLRGADGNIWFTEVFANKIGRLTPDGAVAEFAVSNRGLTRFAAVGSDGNIWFTLAHTASVGYLGSITPAGAITLHPLPTTGPRFVTMGPDGNLWYTDDSNVIGRFSFDGSVVTYQIPTANSLPRGITTGADGNLWFVEFGANQIGKITPNGAITEYAVAGASGADWLIRGSVWFIGNGNSFGKILPSGRASEVAMPDVPGGALLANGRIWFTLQSLNQIGSMTESGKDMHTYDVPTPHANPIGVASGTDGNIYFSEPSADQPKIGVFKP